MKSTLQKYYDSHNSRLPVGKQKYISKPLSGENKALKVFK